MGGEHCQLFQSSYYFPKSRLLLTLHADDIILSGPEQAHEAFWAELQSHLEIEPPTLVDRVLGRKHLFERTEEGCIMRRDMTDYAANACSLYEELSVAFLSLLPLHLCQMVASWQPTGKQKVPFRQGRPEYS